MRIVVLGAAGATGREVVALGGSGTVFSDTTPAIVAAAATAGVKRVVVLSSFAVQRERLTTPMKAMTGVAMKGLVADKTAGEAQLRASDLDWTIVYATMLTDGPRSTASHLVTDGTRIGMRDRISRRDVAGWLLEVAAHDGYQRRAVTITG